MSEQRECPFSKCVDAYCPPDPRIAELEAQLAECAKTFDLFAKDLAEENADLHAQRIAVAEMMRDATLSKIGGNHD